MRYWDMIDVFPKLSRYWDLETRTIDDKAIESEKANMTKEELYILDLFIAIWFNTNKSHSSQAIASEIDTFDEEYKTVILKWLSDPHWP